MNMDMDMDVAWCLTCSKRTRDSRSPYCSEACRLADQSPQSSSTSVPFASPIPVGLYTSPAKSTPRRKDQVSPTKSPAIARPVLRTLPTLPAAGSSSETKPLLLMAEGTRRDRRAFSFPAQASTDPLPFARRHARQSTLLSPSARKSVLSGLTPISQPLDGLQDKSAKSKVNRATKSELATGLNTPLAADSVFLSTSDSSDDGMELKPTLTLTPSPTIQARAQPSTLPDQLAATQFSTLRSQLSTGRANSLHSREASHSPVAALVASSASSRSREDIISWAKAVGMRPGRDQGEEEEAEEAIRGRARTRSKRPSSLARQRSDTLTEAHEGDDNGPDNDTTGSGLGTTPKGRIGSALAGLSMSGYGVGSIVKALTSVTTTPNRSNSKTPHESPESAMMAASTSLVATPSQASVSRVAVFAHTNPSLPLEEAQVQFGGTTPTLSTMSISEVVDPSVQGTHDHVDIYTDDGGMSATSSNFVRRVSMAGKTQAHLRKQSITLQKTAGTNSPVPDRQQRPLPLPLRPISSTATAIWNVTSYLARFAPFSIPSVMSPLAPFAASNASCATTPAMSGAVTPAEPPRASVQPISAAAGPRSRPDSPERRAQEMVRSLPMNIIPPPCSTDEDWERERQRQKEQADLVRLRSSKSRGRSKSRTRRMSRRSRSGSRSRSRSSSRGEWEYRKAIMSPEMPIGSTNQDPDADADVSDDGGDDVDRRGRRGRGTGRKSLLHAVKEADTGALSTETETERGRGRSRSVRPTVRGA